MRHMEKRSTSEILNDLADTLKGSPTEKLTPYQEMFVNTLREKINRDLALANPRLRTTRKLITEAVVGLHLDQSYPGLVDFMKEIGLPGKPRR